MGQRKVFRFPVVVTDHVFDKVRAVDLMLAEFEELLEAGEIIEERRREERILTVSEPDPARWSPDFRSRR